MNTKTYNYTINELTSSVSVADNCNIKSFSGEINSDTVFLLGGETNTGGNSFTSITVIITTTVLFSGGSPFKLVAITLRL